MRDRFIPDTRIHCCVFFINPTGHTLKPVSPVFYLSPICHHGLARLVVLIVYLDRHRRPQEARRGGECCSGYRQVGLLDTGGEGSLQAAGQCDLSIEIEHLV